MYQVVGGNVNANVVIFLADDNEMENGKHVRELLPQFITVYTVCCSSKLEMGKIVP